MSNLPLPTLEQYENFAHHICWAHSWYKHIPLFSGLKFIFFLSKEAGCGYGDEHPRLHYAWKTTQEYRDRFGYLDYGCCPDDRFYYRDGLVESISAIEEERFTCRATIYPFVSTDFNAQEVLHFIIEEECIKKLRLPNSHPKRTELLAWYEAYQTYQEKWCELSDGDNEIAQAFDEEWQEQDLINLPACVATYLQAERQTNNFYWELQKSEFHKIKRSLAHVRALSQENQSVWD
jgi:hypothetical protein